jgi:hypothetical protein
MNAFWASETFNAFIRSEPPNYEILARKLYPKMVQFSGSRLLLAQALERPAAGQVQNVSLGSKPVMLIVSISGYRWVGKRTSPRRAKSSDAVPYSHVGITGESCDEPRYHDE